MKIPSSRSVGRYESKGIQAFALQDVGVGVLTPVHASNFMIV
jgi:hypothetical protein